VCELRDVAPPGLVDGGRFRGRHRQIVGFSYSAVYAVVATVMRFRLLEDLFCLKMVKEIVRI
jgi:hypothetical protein